MSQKGRAGTKDTIDLLNDIYVQNVIDLTNGAAEISREDILIYIYHMYEAAYSTLIRTIHPNLEIILFPRPHPFSLLVTQKINLSIQSINNLSRHMNLISQPIILFLDKHNVPLQNIFLIRNLLNKLLQTRFLVAQLVSEV